MVEEHGPVDSRLIRSAISSMSATSQRMLRAPARSMQRLRARDERGRPNRRNPEPSGGPSLVVDERLLPDEL